MPNENQPYECMETSMGTHSLTRENHRLMRPPITQAYADAVTKLTQCLTCCIDILQRQINDKEVA